MNEIIPEEEKIQIGKRADGNVSHDGELGHENRGPGIKHKSLVNQIILHLRNPRMEQNTLIINSVFILFFLNRT